MKKISALILALVLFSAAVKSQNFMWAKSMGSIGSDQGEAIAVDASGNVYTTGSYSGTVDFDPGAGVFNLTSAGSNDIFLSKLDAAGNFVWAKSMGGTSDDRGYELKIDGAGNVYTTGYFNGTADFDPGAGIFNLVSMGFEEIFISKLDATGSFIWAKRIGAGSDDRGYSITVDAAGNVYTTGHFFNVVDFDPGPGVFNLTGSGTDVFVSKLDASGNFVWAKNMGGGGAGDHGSSISVDGTGNVYTCGYYYSVADFDPGPSVFNLTALGGPDIFVSKLDASGNFLWAKSIGGTGTDIAYSMAIDATGNVYTTGYFENTVDFDPGAGVFNMTSAGFTEVFISKLDASGNFVWAKQIVGGNYEIAYSIALDGSNNIYLTGNFYGIPDFDPGPGVYNLSSNGLYDVFVCKLTNSGNFTWAVSMGGATNDFGHSIVVDAANSIYTTGYYNGTVDFDPGAGVFNITSSGSDDIFIHKIASCAGAPSQPGTISGLTSMCVGAGSSNYSISPIVGATSYTWSLPGGWTGSSTTNTISATPGTSGSFTVTATNACGTSPQQTLNITVNPLPTVTVNSGSICSGNSFTMVAGGASTYTFQGGSATVSPTTTTSYTVTGTSTAGCVSNTFATSNVTVNPTPTISATTNNTLLCAGQSATLTASGASSYTWNPGGAGTNITVSPTVTATYTVTGTNANGCINSFVLTQNVSPCNGINQLVNSVSEVNVYPNPLSSKITIVSNTVKQAVLVFNALGSLIYKTEIENGKTEIDLSKENAGIYFIRIGTEIKKIIKE